MVFFGDTEIWIYYCSFLLIIWRTSMFVAQSNSISIMFGKQNKIYLVLWNLDLKILLVLGNDYNYHSTWIGPKEWSCQTVVSLGNKIDNCFLFIWQTSQYSMIQCFNLCIYIQYVQFSQNHLHWCWNCCTLMVPNCFVNKAQIMCMCTDAFMSSNVSIKTINRKVNQWICFLPLIILPVPSSPMCNKMKR